MHCDHAKFPLAVFFLSGTLLLSLLRFISALAEQGNRTCSSLVTASVAHKYFVFLLTCFFFRLTLRAAGEHTMTKKPQMNLTVDDSRQMKKQAYRSAYFIIMSFYFVACKIRI